MCVARLIISIMFVVWNIGVEPISLSLSLSEKEVRIFCSPMSRGFNKGFLTEIIGNSEEKIRGKKKRLKKKNSNFREKAFLSSSNKKLQILETNWFAHAGKFLKN